MSPRESPTKELDEKYATNIVKLVSEIRTGKLQGSVKIASATVDLLEQIINDLLNATAYELVMVLRASGRRLVRALPHEPVCGNVVRRVLRAIRDEHRAHANQSGEGSTVGGASAAGGGGESLQRLVQAAPARRATLGQAQHDLREPLREHIAELRLELESCVPTICAMAAEHIHCSELILTAGASTLVERFLLAAHQTRPHRLLLAETADDIRQTHEMAARLSAAGVAVTLVTSASVYALMSRVNKVVVGAVAALAGGAVLGVTGTATVALAAKYHSVPVLALAPLHTLTPLHACDPRHLNTLRAPHDTLAYQNESTGEVHVFAPRYDLIPPDHVTLFITNLGGSSPSYVYRLLSELYDPLDHQL